MDRADQEAGIVSNRLREERGLLVIDADVNLSPAEIDRIDQEVRRERELAFAPLESLSRSA